MTWLIVLISGAEAAPVDFARDVRPIFEQHCYKCHGVEKQKNGFRLDVKHEAFHSGDEHAPNIIAGRSAESPLFRFVSGADEKVRMPPKEKDEGGRLKDEEIKIISRWIDEGAAWPEGVDRTKLVDRTDWWSFKPLTRSDGFQPSPSPQTMAGSPRSLGAIDSFILSKLREQGLAPSPEADRRTLIRRLSFDITGLPPSPEEVAAFVGDPDESAYEKLVDRLLASPRYGERWARHWLDLAHYGETHGYDKDKPRPNAWPYRDYVIRAFNEDKPYARFVEEQIAGDVLHPGTVDGITALGFIAAGPWDLIGHAEVPETKIDGKIARHLDRDDMVQNTMGAFCSLTVGCAQCHNHKFDPITQEDYYSLQAVFAALDRADKPYFADAGLTKRFAELQFERRRLTDATKSLDAEAARLAGAALADLDRRIDVATKNVKGNSVPQFGYHSAISAKQDAVKWVQVDLGASMEIDKVVLMPCYDDFNKLGAGFGFPVRFKIEVSDDPSFQKGVALMWRRHDETFMRDFANPGLDAFTTNGTKGDFRGRYVRVTAVKLASRLNDYIFALAEMQVLDEAGKNLAAGAQVSALDTIEAAPRWARRNLVDGHRPLPPDTNGESLAALRKKRAALLDQALPPLKRKALKEHQARLAAISAELARFPKPQMVYAGTVHYGTGAFAGTGPSGGRPRVIQVLKRGDIKNPAREVGPRAIDAITSTARLPFTISGGEEGARRAALAKWITDRNNPLTWRSIVNRVWQHHFGRALVDTPNDFGRMGARPSHPELLDWLAGTFRDDFGGSMKKLHKLIVMSATYRQSSSVAADMRRLSIPSPSATAAPANMSLLTSAATSIDADNRLLWRQNRRKLDAESVRDAILAASGRLDLTMGGPGFQDFVITHPEHSPHYEYQLHDPEDPKSWRRSIYRFIVRSQQQPFMTTLDCADPSMRVDKRNESLSPLQALAMMNNGLITVMARHFAGRVRKECEGIEAQVLRAFELALSRMPSKDELAPLVEYARHEGLENTCRVLLNLNEFSFVD